MKKLNFFVLLISLSILFSCSKDDGSTNTPIIPDDNQYKITLTGTAITNGFCTGSNNESYSIKGEYLSDSNVVSTQQWNGSNDNVQINDEEILTGDIIGLKLKLIDFNINNQNSGKGTEFKNISIKIVNVKSNEVILNKTNIFNLFICTDAIYEAKLLYDVNKGTFTHSTESHGF